MYIYMYLYIYFLFIFKSHVTDNNAYHAYESK